MAEKYDDVRENYERARRGEKVNFQPTVIEGGKSDERPQNGILTGAEFIAHHVPPPWLIDGVVQRSRLYCCTSLTGHGKTALWLFNACMIHAGRQIGQIETYQGNVLFLAGENPADLEARMIGMALTYNIPRERLPFVLPGSFPLDDDAATKLQKEIAKLGVPLVLIIGDTASSFFPGDDENNNAQAGDYARTWRALIAGCAGNPAVMALCHPIKNASRTNLVPRGGGALLNEMDANLANWLERPGEIVELHWQGKIRGPDFAALYYRLRRVPTGLIDERGRPEVTVVAEPLSEEAAANQAKQALANEDAVLIMVRDHPDWSQADMARHAGWVDDAGRPEKWLVARALEKLRSGKLVRQLRNGRHRITDTGESALRGEV